MVPIQEVFSVMAAFTPPWFIAGGWAIDLHIGAETRIHGDIEIGLFRRDQEQLHQYLPDWQFTKVIPGTPSQKEDWIRSEYLKLPVHEGYVRSPDGKVLEVLLSEGDDTHWIFRRDLRIRRELNAAILFTRDNIPYLAPEIVLLFKSKGSREKDIQDFHNMLPLLTAKQKSWLKNAVQVCYSEHDWLSGF